MSGSVSVWNKDLLSEELVCYASAKDGSHARTFRTVAYAVEAYYTTNSDGSPATVASWGRHLSRSVLLGVVATYPEALALLRTTREFVDVNGRSLFGGGCVRSVPREPLTAASAWAKNEMAFDALAELRWKEAHPEGDDAGGG